MASGHLAQGIFVQVAWHVFSHGRRFMSSLSVSRMVRVRLRQPSGCTDINFQPQRDQSLSVQKFAYLHFDASRFFPLASLLLCSTPSFELLSCHLSELFQDCILSTSASHHLNCLHDVQDAFLAKTFSEIHLVLQPLVHDLDFFTISDSFCFCIADQPRS